MNERQSQKLIGQLILLAGVLSAIVTIVMRNEVNVLLWGVIISFLLIIWGWLIGKQKSHYTLFLYSSFVLGVCFVGTNIWLLSKQRIPLTNVNSGIQELIVQEVILETQPEKSEPMAQESTDLESNLTPQSSETNQQRAIPSISIENVDSLEVIQVFGNTLENSSAIAMSPDGQMLAASYEADIKLWQVSDGALLHTFKGHTKAVEAITFSPDGQILASGGKDSTVKFWRISDSTLIWSLSEIPEFEDSVFSITFSPNGQMLIVTSGESNTITLRRLSDGALIREFVGHDQAVVSVAFSPDSSLLASASWDYTVRLWQVSDGKVRYILEGHNNPVYGVAFSPDGQILASVGNSETGKLWKVSDGTLLSDFSGNDDKGAWSIVFSPDGQMLASRGYLGDVKLIHANNGRVLHTLFTKEGLLRSFFFSPNGRYLVTNAGIISDPLGAVHLYGVPIEAEISAESPPCLPVSIEKSGWGMSFKFKETDISTLGREVKINKFEVCSSGEEEYKILNLQLNVYLSDEDPIEYTCQYSDKLSCEGHHPSGDFNPYNVQIQMAGPHTFSITNHFEELLVSMCFFLKQENVESTCNDIHNANYEITENGED